MDKYKLTRIWRVNHKLIIADTIEEAIELYKIWTREMPNVLSDEVTEIRAVGDSQIPENFNAIIKE